MIAGKPRSGMWVVDAEGRVGIMTGFNEAGTPGYVTEGVETPAMPPFGVDDFVNEQGETIIASVKLPLDELTVARYREIPEPRKVGRSQQEFAAMGYL